MRKIGHQKAPLVFNMVSEVIQHGVESQNIGHEEVLYVYDMIYNFSYKRAA